MQGVRGCKGCKGAVVVACALGPVPRCMLQQRGGCGGGSTAAGVAVRTPARLQGWCWGKRSGGGGPLRDGVNRW